MQPTDQLLCSEYDGNGQQITMVLFVQDLTHLDVKLPLRHYPYFTEPMSKCDGHRTEPMSVTPVASGFEAALRPQTQ